MRALEVSAIVFSVITGLISSLLIVFKGGALVQLVETHESRIASIESRGSPPITEHIKLDDLRESRSREDIRRLENIVMQYADLGAKMEAVNLKLELVREELRKRP